MYQCALCSHPKPTLVISHLNLPHFTYVAPTSISGRVPELVLYGDDGAELERMFVDKLSGHELHTLVQSKGFARAKPTS